MSIRTGDESTMISDNAVVGEHHCTFWSSIFAP
jgi:hypothetical protein